MRRASSDYQSLVKYNEADDYEPNKTNTDYFDYNQDVISLYSMYSRRLKNQVFAWVPGSNTRLWMVTLPSSSTQVKQDYVTFLPKCSVYQPCDPDNNPRVCLYKKITAALYLGS
jgi:hypothetical protein